MFRSRPKFDNEAPMSRRGMRVGLVLTVVLVMVAVLASTVGVLSSQSTTPSLTFGSGTYSAVEGESLTITLNSTSTENYALVLDTIAPTDTNFDFENDVSGLVLTPNVGEQVIITDLPQTVSIESRTTMITLLFRGANDISDESDEMFTLSAKPGAGTAVTTAITLTDPPQLEATFSVTSPINEGDRAPITIDLNAPLTRAHAQSTITGEDGYDEEEFTSSSFEDISSIKGAAFPVDVQNGSYLRNLGFDFWFYGKRHSHIAVHTNGFIGFTNDTANVEIEVNADNPAAAPGNVGSGDDTPGVAPFVLPGLAPLLSPINYRNPTSLDPAPAFYGAHLGAGTPQERYIVQYTNAQVGTASGRVSATFQVVLYPNGRIRFSYDSVPTSVQQVAKIGISNGDGTTMFEEYSYETDKLNTSGTSRIEYDPQDSLVNAVIDSDGTRFWTRALIRTDFSVGDQSKSIMSGTHPDNSNWDGSRVYTVSLETDARSAHLFTAPAAVMYTVNDNDDPVVTLERVSGNGPIAEGASVELRVSLDNAPDGAPEELTVNLARDTASTAGTSDYDTIPTTVTIPAGERNSNSFTVMITDDNDTESEEVLTIEVGNLAYGSTTINQPATPKKIDLTIPRSDTIAVMGITVSDAPEGGQATVRVTLNRVLPASVGIGDVTLVLDGTDRTNDVTDTGWNIGDALKANTSAEVMIPLTQDTILEGDERVTLSLDVHSSLDDIFPAGDRGSGVSFDIIDDEDGTIGFIAPTTTTYNEGDSVVLLVGLASGVTIAASDITVNYKTGSVTRVATILAGQSTAAITIALPDDGVAEETEMFRVTLTGASSSNAALNAKVAMSTSPQTRDITVLDNEPLEYEFVGGGTMVSEGGTTPYTVRLRRLGMLPDSGSGAMVAYTIAGSGISAADFVGGSPLRGNFVFSNYAAESAVTLTVADDNSLEGEETFRITAAGETLDVKLVDNESWDIGIVRLGANDSPEEGDLVRFRIELMLESGVRTATDITVEYEIMASPGLVAVSAPGLRSGFAQGLALPVRGLAQAQMVTLKRTATIPAGQSGVDIAIQLDESPDDTQQLMVSLGGVSTNSGDPLPKVSFTGPSIPVASPSVLTVPVLDRVVVDGYFGDLPPTGGPVLPVWLLVVLALAGVALLVPTLWFKPRNTRK